MNVEDFDGTTAADTLTQYGDWFRQYGTMVTSKVTPNKFTADWTPHADSLLKGGGIPIMVLHVQYHKFITVSVTLSSLNTLQKSQ